VDGASLIHPTFGATSFYKQFHPSIKASATYLPQRQLIKNPEDIPLVVLKTR
jgi:hypothetical protein